MLIKGVKRRDGRTVAEKLIYVALGLLLYMLIRPAVFLPNSDAAAWCAGFDAGYSYRWCRLDHEECAARPETPVCAAPASIPSGQDPFSAGASAGAHRAFYDQESIHGAGAELSD